MESNTTNLDWNVRHTRLKQQAFAKSLKKSIKDAEILKTTEENTQANLSGIDMPPLGMSNLESLYLKVARSASKAPVNNSQVLSQLSKVGLIDILNDQDSKELQKHYGLDIADDEIDKLAADLEQKGGEWNLGDLGSVASHDHAKPILHQYFVLLGAYHKTKDQGKDGFGAQLKNLVRQFEQEHADELQHNISGLDQDLEIYRQIYTSDQLSVHEIDAFTQHLLTKEAPLTALDAFFTKHSHLSITQQYFILTLVYKQAKLAGKSKFVHELLPLMQQFKRQNAGELYELALLLKNIKLAEYQEQHKLKPGTIDKLASLNSGKLSLNTKDTIQFIFQNMESTPISALLQVKAQQLKKQNLTKAELHNVMLFEFEIIKIQSLLTKLGMIVNYQPQFN